jgi:hemolysin activation/secretion protein
MGGRGILLGLSLALCGAAPAALAAQAPSVLIPPTRADQSPVAPAYRQPVLEPRLQAVLAPSSTPPFRLAEVEVDGSSLPAKVLKRAYRPWLGRTVGDAELKALADAVASAYATRSDIALYSVAIPRQTFGKGLLHVQVSEGFIQGVRVTAPPRSTRSNALLARYLKRLMAERQLKRSTLERYSALIHDIAGLNATLQFAPGSGAGGLILVVATRPRLAEIGFGINNRGTAYLGRTQADVDLALHGLLRQGEDTHVTVAVPTDFDRFRYYSFSDSEPLGATGASLAASAGYLQTRPRFADLHGHAVTVGLSATAPVVRRNDQSVYLTAGLDGVDSDNALLGEEISNDRIRTVRVGASYVRQNKRYFLLVNGSANFGLAGLGAHTLSPSVSDLKFRKYTLKANLNLAVARDLVLRLDGAGQYTVDRLPASEQLALGGEEFGRAYEAAIIAGDQGAAASAELAWKLTHLAPPPLQGSELYAFTDAGRTQRLSRPLEPALIQQLASVGAGARVAITGHAVVQLEADRGLLNPVPTEDHEGWRGVFSIRSSF